MPRDQARKKALVILTNISRLSTREDPENIHFTGFDAKAVAHLWSLLVLKNFYQIDYCTPLGGPAPMDPKSAEESKDDPVVHAFLQNKSLVDSFQETMSAKTILDSNSLDYNIVALVGAHGALIDMASSSDISKLVSGIFESDGILCAMGHGLAGAIGSSINGEPLLKGKRVACSTRTEDEKQDIALPFFLDEKLMALGAWVLNKGPFEVNVCIDENEEGKIITAQNTKSVSAWIELLETQI